MVGRAQRETDIAQQSAWKQTTGINQCRAQSDRMPDRKARSASMTQIDVVIRR